MTGFAQNTPFLYFARSEGELLYCRDQYQFRRPKHPANFTKAYADAKLHFDTFWTLGKELIEQAQEVFGKRRNLRLAALFSAQAAVLFYHTLYYVYHGREFENHDPIIMHDRMRTLSTQLMLTFDDNHLENIFTMPYLKQLFRKARYNVDFDIPPTELERYLDCMLKLGSIIENCRNQRLKLYQALSEQR